MEGRRIIKGFRKRGRFQMELTRLNAWCSFFAFRKNELGIGPERWLPFTWEKDTGPGISDEEAKALQDAMKDMKI